jgi:hypothetical protein
MSSKLKLFQETEISRCLHNRSSQFYTLIAVIELVPISVFYHVTH